MTEFNRKEDKDWRNFAEYFAKVRIAPQNEYGSQEALQKEDASARSIR